MTFRKVFIETLGCQMNFSDSELMLGLLRGEGFEPTAEPTEADLLIINTCQIRGSAEDKAYSHLGRWRKLKMQKPDVRIAMAGCVAVPANNCRPRQGKALLQPDDMDNPLFAVRRVDIADAKGGGILLERRKLLRAFLVGDRNAHTLRIAPRRGWQVVIGHGKRQIGPAHRPASYTQPFESLRARDFMNEMAIDEDEASAIVTSADDMRVPDLLVECAGS